MIGGFRRRARVRRALELLDKERSCLRAGALTEVLALAQEREAIIAELVEDPDVPKTEMARIAESSRRNAALMQAALDGIHSAERILAEIARKQSRLGTYDATGRLGESVVAVPRHEKRL